ncbi:tRNA-His guanylyltransferase [Lignoscripta atroalba]|nr:tRNA-His guanylyltransferase [Lignoscripta atroalba]
MANSKYEYVKTFEKDDCLLPSTFIVVRIDGRGFHKFSKAYNFQKPNDRHALDLMNAAATAVLNEMQDVTIAYGVSDEFSFVFGPHCTLFERRESKILTTVVSTFTSYYIHLWPIYFPATPLSPPLPSFDGRVVLYPDVQLLRDYMSWRQVDCHINNLYNTTFWAMVLEEGKSPTQAEEDLKGTFAADKNEILFSRFKINYNDEPEIFKKGSVVYRNYGSGHLQSDEVADENEGLGGMASKTQKAKNRKKRAKATIVIEHIDLIKDDFWSTRTWLLPGRLG